MRIQLRSSHNRVVAVLRVKPRLSHVRIRVVARPIGFCPQKTNSIRCVNGKEVWIGYRMQPFARVVLSTPVEAQLVFPPASIGALQRTPNTTPGSNTLTTVCKGRTTSAGKAASSTFVRREPSSVVLLPGCCGTREPFNQRLSVWCEVRALPIPPQGARSTHTWRQFYLNTTIAHPIDGVVGVLPR